MFVCQWTCNAEDAGDGADDAVHVPGGGGHHAGLNVHSHVLCWKMVFDIY